MRSIPNAGSEETTGPAKCLGKSRFQREYEIRHQRPAISQRVATP